MEVPEKIVNGFSTFGEISMSSAIYRASAKILFKEWKIRVQVEKIPEGQRRVRKNKSWYYPRVLTFFLQLADNRTFRWLIGFIAVINTIAFIRRRLGYVPQPGVLANPILIHAIPYIFFLMFAAYLRYFIAKWHGAEHMVIAAYNKSKKLEPDFIKQQSPVNEDCGGRFFLPFILLNLFSDRAAQALGCSSLLTTLLFWELILRIDEWFGWHNLPLFRQASYLIQRYVTTAYPERLQFMVANWAAHALVYAHKNPDKVNKRIVQDSDIN